MMDGQTVGVPRVDGGISHLFLPAGGEHLAPLAVAAADDPHPVWVPDWE